MLVGMSADVLGQVVGARKHLSTAQEGALEGLLAGVNAHVALEVLQSLEHLLASLHGTRMEFSAGLERHFVGFPTTCRHVDAWFGMRMFGA